MIVGTDIDGVLCRNLNTSIDNFFGRLFGSFYYQTYHKICHCKLHNAYFDYVITARPEEDRKLTESWLKRNGIKYKELIIVNTHNIQEAAILKAKWVKKLKIEVFYEDSKPIIDQIENTTYCKCFEFLDLNNKHWTDL